MGAHDGGRWPTVVRTTIVDPHDVEVVETFGNLAQLVLVLLVVEGCAHGLNRLVPFGLAVLWHEQGLVRRFDVEFVEGLTLDDLLLEQEIVECCLWVVDVRLQTHAHVARIRWHLFRLGHLFEHVVENSDLVDAHLDAFRHLFGHLVGLLVPGVGHDLFEAVAEFGVGHQDIVDEALDLVR